MNRLYAARVDADVHRRPRRPSPADEAQRRSRESRREIARAIGRAVAEAPRARREPPRRSSGASGRAKAEWIAAVAKDLLAHRGRSLVIAGDGQPPAVHALAHAMNQTLGNVGKTVVYTDPVEAEPVDQLESLRELVADMNAGKVDLLLILGGNPVYTAPADLKFAEAMSKVQLRAHLSLYDDETSELCHWQIPEAHFLEAWSDARGYDGTASIVQPLIAPLYGGSSAHEVLAALSDRPERSALRHRPRALEDRAATTIRAVWRRWLHDGVVSGHGVRARQSVNRPTRSDQTRLGFEPPIRNRESQRLRDLFPTRSLRPRRPVRQQRLAAGAAEADHQAHLGQRGASSARRPRERLKSVESPSFQGGEHGQIISDVVELKYQGRTVRGAVFAVVGHPDDCVTVHLGYGRTRAGASAPAPASTPTPSARRRRCGSAPASRSRSPASERRSPARSTTT